MGFGFEAAGWGKWDGGGDIVVVAVIVVVAAGAGAAVPPPGVGMRIPSLPWGQFRDIVVVYGIKKSRREIDG